MKMSLKQKGAIQPPPVLADPAVAGFTNHPVLARRHRRDPLASVPQRPD